jgi:hypothetical protein
VVGVMVEVVGEGGRLLYFYFTDLKSSCKIVALRRKMFIINFFHSFYNCAPRRAMYKNCSI